MEPVQLGATDRGATSPETPETPARTARRTPTLPPAPQGWQLHPESPCQPEGDPVRRPAPQERLMTPDKEKPPQDRGVLEATKRLFLERVPLTADRPGNHRGPRRRTTGREKLQDLDTHTSSKRRNHQEGQGSAARQPTVEPVMGPPPWAQ